jgi:DNA polymerase elongation subunit (family B)
VYNIMWLFDAYPVEGGMAVWLLDDWYRPRRILEPFQPALYVREPERGVPALWRVLKGLPVDVAETEKIEFISGRPIRVWQVKVRDPIQYARVARTLQRLQDDVELFNADIALPQMFFYERGLFPLARVDEALRTEDSPWEVEYELPFLRSAYLRMDSSVDPRHTRLTSLSWTVDGTTTVIDWDDDRTGLATLRQLLLRSDPDMLLTDWGDAYLIPTLLALSERERIPPPLNRDEGPVESRAERSYWSYGRQVYKAGWQLLRGRWHIDLMNTFIVGEASFAGLFELSRASKLPVQMMARTTTGTAITSMQLDEAYRRDILIPWQKRVPEDFKTADELLLTDKGGLVYVPKPGLYEHVGEIDFASMFPAIMVRHNVSPETVNCACCPDAKVPEIEHRICRRRRGLVPSVLAPIVAKRAEFKRRFRETADLQWKEKSTAYKWLLVVSFGYLGYKNARFGRIEAHECTTALSREKLLQAKELAEEAGFEMAHAIVDSLYLRKPGAAAEDFEALARAIGEKTGVEAAVENIFDWIAFYPARRHALWGVPNRFVGCAKGELKIRGVEARRHDVPPIVREMQGEMLRLLAKAKSGAEYRAALPAAREIFETYKARVTEGRATQEELVITRRLSHRPGDYKVDNVTSIAARQLEGQGVELMPGQEIQILLTDDGSRSVAYGLTTGRAVPIDAARYVELLESALETIESVVPRHIVPAIRQLTLF